PLVLGLVRVGAGDQDRPLGAVGQGRPHLLPVDDPLVTVPDRPRGQGGEVGSGAGLAEQLAPDLLASPQGTQESTPLFVVAEPQDRGSGHPQADGVLPRTVVRRASLGEFGFDDGLQLPGRAHAAEPGGEVHPREPGVEPRPKEFQPIHPLLIVLGEEFPHSLTEFVDVHRCHALGAPATSGRWPGANGERPAARQVTRWAMASGLPAGPAGIVLTAALVKSSKDIRTRSAVALVMSVAMKPGAMAFTVIPNLPSSI